MGKLKNFFENYEQSEKGMEELCTELTTILGEILNNAPKEETNRLKEFRIELISKNRILKAARNDLRLNNTNQNREYFNESRRITIVLIEEIRWSDIIKNYFLFEDQNEIEGAERSIQGREMLKPDERSSGISTDPHIPEKATKGLDVSDRKLMRLIIEGEVALTDLNPKTRRRLSSSLEDEPGSHLRIETG